MKSNILGYLVTLDSKSEIADLVAKGSVAADRQARRCSWLACLNPHSYAEAKKDSRFRAALADADWLVPDGIGIVLAARILGIKLEARVTGYDVFEEVLKRLDRQKGRSVFFLGSSEETLRKIERRLRSDYPNVRVAGVYSPPFKSEYSDSEIEQMISAINLAKPDVLWVGMTAPKQEKWIWENRDRLDVQFAAAIGAVFDFYSGRIRRSAPMFQRLGLEWLPRLMREPRRLWRRSFVSAPMFFVDVFRARSRHFGRRV